MLEFTTLGSYTLLLCTNKTWEGQIVKVNRAPTKVWRISEAAPMGEWVDISLTPRRGKMPPVPEESQGAWVRSSYDLLDGIDVQDDGEPVSDEVFDELFKQGNNLSGKSPP